MNPKDKKMYTLMRLFFFLFRIKNNIPRHIIRYFHFSTPIWTFPRISKNEEGKLEMGKYWNKNIQHLKHESRIGSHYIIWKGLQNPQNKGSLCLFFWCACAVKLQLVVIGVACVAQRDLMQVCSRVQNGTSKTQFLLPTFNFTVSFR